MSSSRPVVVFVILGYSTNNLLIFNPNDNHFFLSSTALLSEKIFSRLLQLLLMDLQTAMSNRYWGILISAVDFPSNNFTVLLSFDSWRDWNIYNFNDFMLKLLLFLMTTHLDFFRDEIAAFIEWTWTFFDIFEGQQVFWLIKINICQNQF